MLVLWLTGYLALIPALESIEPLRLAVFLAFLALAVLTARPIARILIFIAMTAALATSAHGGGPGILVKAADFSIIFTIFLPTLVLVRETMNRAPETQDAQAAFAALRSEDRMAGLTGAVHVLAAFLILGALFMTGPFVASETDRKKRKREALAAMRGFGLAVYWSPFTIGMAFALTSRPEVQLWQAMALGFLLAILGIALSLTLFTPGAAFRGLGRALSALRPIAFSAAVSLIAVVALATVTTLGTVAAVSLVMPVLSLLRLTQLGLGQAVDGLRTSVMRLDRLGDEFLLFTAAAIFGFTLQETGGAEAVATWLALDRVPILLLPLVIISFGTLLALLGVHSVVIGGLVVALLAPVDPRIPDLVEVAMILVPWGTAAIISYASLSVVTAVSVYKLAFTDFVLSINLAFLLLMALISATMFVPFFFLG